jgi:hypothetical protein
MGADLAAMRGPEVGQRNEGDTAYIAEGVAEEEADFGQGDCKPRRIREEVELSTDERGRTAR